MPLREFTDAEGVHWRVWDVHPRLEVVPEEGFGVERRVADAPELIVERRRRAEPHGQAGGAWLVFHSGDEKRRLSPVPDDWEVCPAERLMEYRDRAEPAAPRSP